jgi:phage protein F-like protein|nr:MAG TPA: minor capsid component [Caudoviricetes sp.]
MLTFSPVRVLRKRKSSNEAEEILRRLDDFLHAESPQLAQWFYSVFQDQQAAVTYKELREAALSGYEEQILQWQDDYARLINEHFAPVYFAAMKEGAKAWEEKLGGTLLDDSDREVQNWIRERTAGFITNIGEETRMAVKTILWKGQQERWTAAQIARYIRPCIGLTKSDAAANARYQQSVYDSLLKAHPRMTEASAAKKAQEAALKYAARQHRARADMIANTELAFAYNRGENMSIRNAMRDGLMGGCVKVWRTAGSERVCPHCGALDGKEIGFDESFDIKGKELFPGMHETPPAHPRCRCVVQYKEIAAPARGLRSGEGQRKAPDHPVPQELGHIDFTDKNMVQSTIEHFEAQIVAQKVENAIVITKEGRVVRCVANINAVYPDEDLGDELRGAVVTHNHPVGSDNEWSFSKADINLFTLYELSILRGIDEKYVYELNRFPQDIDKIPSFAEAEELVFRHSMVIQEAKRRGFGYRRWKR